MKDVAARLKAVLSSAWTWVLLAGICVVLGTVIGASYATLRLPISMGVNVAPALWTGGLVAMLLIIVRKRFPNAAHEMSWGEAAAIWTLIVLLWWTVASGFDIGRASLLAGSGFLALVVGLAIGFLTTTFGSENTNVIGKTRDLIFGGIAGITLTGLLSNSDKFIKFFQALSKAEPPIHPAIQAGNVSLLAFLGFMAMFVLRELYLNSALQAKRKEIEEKESAKQALETQPVDQDAKPVVPSSVKSPLAPPVQDEKKATDVVETVRSAGLSPEQLDSVNRLRLAQTYVRARKPLDATKVLDDLLSQGQHVEAALRIYGDAADQDEDGKLGVHRQAADQMLRFAHVLGPDANHFAGYHLLWVPDRLRESIEYSKRYLQTNPKSSMTLFNIGCAFGQLFMRNDESKQANGQEAIRYLKEAVALDPEVKSLIRRWSSRSDDDLHGLAVDATFGPQIRSILE